MTRNEILQSLSDFQQEKQSEYHIRKIGIFGSAARGQLRDDSDVDVVVELDNPDLLILVGIKQDLEEKFQRSVDIVRLRDAMNVFSRKNALNKKLFMSDVALVREILRQLHWSAQTILKRFEPIQSPDDFPARLMRDWKNWSICMQLITLGENVKSG